MCGIDNCSPAAHVAIPPPPASEDGGIPRSFVEAMVKAIVSFYYAVSGDQFAEAVGNSSEALYLRFSALAAELGDLPVSVIERVVEAYFQMIEAEQKQHRSDLPLPSGSVTRPDERVPMSENTDI